MKTFIKKFSVNATVIASLLFTVSCDDKKSGDPALQAAQELKTKIEKYSNEDALIDAFGEFIANDPQVKNDISKLGVSPDEITDKIKEYVDIEITNEGIETASENGLGSVLVKSPAFIIRAEEGKLPEGADFPKDAELKITYPDTITYVDPDKNAEYQYKSSGTMEFLVKGLPDIQHIPFIGTTEDGYTKLFSIYGDTSGDFKFNEEFENGGSIYPYKANFVSKNFELKDGKAGGALIKIAELVSNQEVIEHNEKATRSSGSASIKNMQLGDMVKLFIGDVKPMDIFIDLDSNIRYKSPEEETAANILNDDMPFKSMNLGIHKFEIATAGGAISLDGIFDLGEKPATEEIPFAMPDVNVDVNINVSNYQQLTAYIRSLAPFIPAQISNDKLFAVAKDLAGTSSDEELSFKIKANTEGMTINGRTEAELEQVVGKHFQ